MQNLVPGMWIAWTPRGTVISKPPSMSQRTKKIPLTQRLFGYTAWTRRRKRKDDDEIDAMQQHPIAMKIGSQSLRGMAKYEA
jgi:hypothetical protein